MIAWLENEGQPLPPTTQALGAGSEAPGLLVAGGAITERRLNDSLTQRAALDTELADDGFYARASVARQQATLQARARLQREIEALENQWLDISEQLAEQQQR